MHACQCVNCRNYWANNVIHTLTMLINRMCPDCVAQLPVITWKVCE